MPKVMFRSSFL